MAVDVGDDPSGLFDDQRAGRVVPGRKRELEKELCPSGRDEAQVERRGSRPPDVDRLPEIRVGELEGTFAQFFVVGRGSEENQSAP